jgi:histidinol-phosphate aminotransferase
LTSDLLDFSLNINPCGAPAASLEAAARALRDSHLYPPRDAGELRVALAAWHGVTPDSLIFGCGVDELIKLAVHAWTQPGDAAVIHVPTFPRYEIELRCHGARVVEVWSPDPWRLDIARLSEALGAHRPAAAFLCLPNNPTAANLTAVDVTRLARAFPATRFAVDEAMAYPLDEGLVGVASREPNVVVMRTFSKYYGLAGLRVGYGIGGGSTLAAMEAARPPFNVSAVAVAAALAALDDVAFVERCKQVFAEEVGRFRARVDGLPGCRVVSALSNVVLVQLAGVSAESVMDGLATRGLRVRDAREFRGLEESNCIRISLLDAEANARLADGLEELCHSNPESLGAATASQFGSDHRRSAKC